ncbi:MAG: HlyD family type I secretion periplasmic adaptor subunit [Proteobacteria bacterium]|nr:HlyD family type I secretion periplasmic adaptor subunit [Pseudomonadota bacterium]
MAGARFREDADFMPAVHAATRSGARPSAYFLLFIIALFFVVFLGWARVATLEEVTRGDGKVIPSSQIQVVQNLEGGIVAGISVREGEVVDKGQILIRIDQTQAAAGYRESRAKYLSLLAAVARLKAEVDGTEIAFPDEVLDDAPNVAAAELALFASRQSGLKTDLSILRRQEDQRRQELVELRGRLVRLKESYQLVAEELKIIEPLVSSGVVSKVELLRLRREANNIKGDREATRLAIPRASSALREATERIEERKISLRTESLQELNQRSAELAVIAQTIASGRDRALRADVRSPVHGTVKQILVTTVGGVIRPGQDLVEIVPLEDTLLIEARIRPADIAFLRPGQDATVKITAYDFSIYGGLKAKVEHISADTIEDEQQKGETFYRIRLRTELSYLGTEQEPLPIIPGMTASVDILTGEKTVLDYLLKPILKVRNRALRER